MSQLNSELNTHSCCVTPLTYVSQTTTRFVLRHHVTFTHHARLKLIAVRFASLARFTHFTSFAELLIRGNMIVPISVVINHQYSVI